MRQEEAHATTSDHFIVRYEIWTPQQCEAAERIEHELRDSSISRVRVSWVDQHGLLRSKTLTVPAFARALHRGVPFQSAPLLMDTSNRPVVAPWSSDVGFGLDELARFPDQILVPDPDTFRSLPWAPGVGWVLGELYFRDGSRNPLCTRGMFRQLLARVASSGYQYLTGIELECGIYRLLDERLSPEDSGQPPAPPAVTHVSHGYQYLSEEIVDRMDLIVRLLEEQLQALGLPLATIESEWGPSQMELTFDPVPGLVSADTVALVRSAVKQICRRHGYHASFMPRPALANTNPNGWHLHQSLLNDGGANAFSADTEAGMSDTGRWFLGGLLEHALPCVLPSDPLVNSYKRFERDSFAPGTVCWTHDTRGAMVRVLAGGDPASTRIENRIGDPSANPYLYLSAQLAAGMDGVTHHTEPPPATTGERITEHPRLPRDLGEAIAHFNASALLRAELGDTFVDYLTRIKQHEFERFRAHVTDWEQREYFEIF